MTFKIFDNYHLINYISKAYQWHSLFTSILLIFKHLNQLIRNSNLLSLELQYNVKSDLNLNDAVAIFLRKIRAGIYSVSPVKIFCSLPVLSPHCSVIVLRTSLDFLREKMTNINEIIEHLIYWTKDNLADTGQSHSKKFTVVRK